MSAGSRPVATPRERRTAWLMLAAAASFEVLFATTVNAAQGFTVLVPSVLCLLSLATAVFLLSQSLKVLDAAVGYTIWTGVGTIGSVLLGAVLFDEALSAAKLCFLTLIIAGVLGLRSSASGH